MGFSSLFPVQVAVWHETVGPGAFEQDLCINSPTGSGKTLAYALPIVNMMSSCAVKCLRALVVLPTRDLALQVTCLLMHIICHSCTSFVVFLFMGHGTTSLLSRSIRCVCI